MRVERGDDFKPITIILETEDELRAMYHIANHAETKELKEYLQNYKTTCAQVDAFRHRLWVELNKYKPAHI